MGLPLCLSAVGAIVDPLLTLLGFASDVGLLPGANGKMSLVAPGMLGKSVATLRHHQSSPLTIIEIVVHQSIKHNKCVRGGIW